MDREIFFFEEVLKKERLNSDGDNVEAAIWNVPTDLGVAGILSGGGVTVATGAPTLTVEPFIAADRQGRRMFLNSETDFDFSLDYTGAATAPSSGNYRWVTAVLRYGKLGSSPVVDGDGATVYTIETEGFSSAGDVTVDSGSTNFGKLRFIAGTQSGSPSSANRPAVTSPDIILCDILIDSTGNAVGGQAGVSRARATIGSTNIRTALNQSDSNYDAIKYVLLESTNLFDDGIVLRKYAGRKTGGYDPLIVFTINAGWDAINNVWAADVSGRRSLLVEMSTFGLAVNMQNRSTPTWTDARHSALGWDSRIEMLGNYTDALTTISADGVITGSGAQTAYAAYGGDSDANGIADVKATGFTWAQQMAADPSSVTLSAGITSDENVALGGGFLVNAVANKFGGEMKFSPSGPNVHVFCARKIVAVP